jgi:drug/metabolite transporter (DMT)-like permease
LSPLATLLWITNLFIDTFGQLSFKAASRTHSATGVAARWRAMLTTPWLWLGIGTYIVEFFVYLAFLSKVPLSEGVLMTSLNIVAVMIGGRFIFKEALTPSRVLATFLIATGVALVGWGGFSK